MKSGIKIKKNHIFNLLYKNNYDVKILSGSFWMWDIYGYKVKGTKIENLYSIEELEGFQNYVYHCQKYSRSSKYYKNIIKEIIVLL